ncbi:hypothetical protein KUCAC02_023613, partial [Chaenocephalus aceratus]
VSAACSFSQQDEEGSLSAQDAMCQTRTPGPKRGGRGCFMHFADGLPHPDSWKPISNHSVREGVQRSVLRPAPTHCQGPACFIELEFRKQRHAVCAMTCFSRSISAGLRPDAEATTACAGSTPITNYSGTSSQYDLSSRVEG